MKLYATVESERASKGQGGNSYIHIDLKNEDNETVAKIAYTDTGISIMHLESVFAEIEAVSHLINKKGIIKNKGEQKKSETCLTCSDRGWLSNNEKCLNCNPLGNR